jgi:hypothetical protein
MPIIQQRLGLGAAGANARLRLHGLHVVIEIVIQADPLADVTEVMFQRLVANQEIYQRSIVLGINSPVIIDRVRIVANELIEITVLIVLFDIVVPVPSICKIERADETIKRVSHHRKREVVVPHLLSDFPLDLPSLHVLMETRAGATAEDLSQAARHPTRRASEILRRDTANARAQGVFGRQQRREDVTVGAMERKCQFQRRAGRLARLDEDEPT